MIGSAAVAVVALITAGKVSICESTHPGRDAASSRAESSVHCVFLPITSRASLARKRDFPSKCAGGRPEGRGGAESSRRWRLTDGRTPRDPDVGAASRRGQGQRDGLGPEPGPARLPRAREGRPDEGLQLGRAALQSVHGNVHFVN